MNRFLYLEQSVLNSRIYVIFSANIFLMSIYNLKCHTRSFIIINHPVRRDHRCYAVSLESSSRQRAGIATLSFSKCPFSSFRTLGFHTADTCATLVEARCYTSRLSIHYQTAHLRCPLQWRCRLRLHQGLPPLSDPGLPFA
jgi:hypothetical protein